MNITQIAIWFSVGMFIGTFIITRYAGVKRWIFSRQEARKINLIHEAVNFFVAKRGLIHVPIVVQPTYLYCTWYGGILGKFKDTRYENKIEFSIEVDPRYSDKSLVKTCAHEVRHFEQHVMGWADNEDNWLRVNHKGTPYANQPWEIDARSVEKDWAEDFWKYRKEKKQALID